MPKVELNSKAPEIVLNTFEGKLFRLSEQEGSNVLLVFNRGFT